LTTNRATTTGNAAAPWKASIRATTPASTTNLTGAPDKRVLVKSRVRAKLHAGICEGGTGQPVSLPRQPKAGNVCRVLPPLCDRTKTVETRDSNPLTFAS
jgi:hypothetical protein